MYSEFEFFSVVRKERLRIVNYSSLKHRSLLLFSPPPVSGDSLKRNDWLVDFPLPEEGGYSLSLSGNAPQPGFRRGLKAYIPPPCGEHASETDMPNLTVLLFERVPYHFRCGYRKHAMFIHKLFRRGKSVYLLSKDRSFTASPKTPTFFIRMLKRGE
jgi:hypothetical protein